MIQGDPIAVVVDRRATVKTVPLNCNHCGAPLSVPESARFVTCAHCHAQLAIHHEGAAFFTEVLDKLKTQTDDIADSLFEMQRRQDLDRLEIEWAEKRREILGAAPEPPTEIGVMAGTAGIGAGAAIFTVIAFKEPSALMVALVGWGLTYWVWASEWAKINGFEETKEQFDLRRKRILARQARVTEGRP